MQIKQEVTRLRLKAKSFGLGAILTSAISFTSVSAQESVNSAGGIALGSGGSASYSIGQFAGQTYTGTNGSLSEGVQQAYEISVVSAIEDSKGISLSFSVYPNPVTDILQLKVESEKIKDLRYQLFDGQGKLLQNRMITGNYTEVVMSGLVPATYFLKVVSENKEIKMFKIIKN